MDEETTYPADPLDHKRAEFEAGLKQVAVEAYGHSPSDALGKLLCERNRNGRYIVEWVRGAWEGYKMAQTQLTKA